MAQQARGVLIARDVRTLNKRDERERLPGQVEPVPCALAAAAAAASPEAQRRPAKHSTSPGDRDGWRKQRLLVARKLCDDDAARRAICQLGGEDCRGWLKLEPIESRPCTADHCHCRVDMFWLATTLKLQDSERNADCRRASGMWYEAGPRRPELKAAKAATQQQAAAEQQQAAAERAGGSLLLCELSEGPLDGLGMLAVAAHAI